MSIYRCLCLTLVLPWPETSDPAQQWSARSSKLIQLLSGATSSLHRLPPGWNQDSQLQEQGTSFREKNLKSALTCALVENFSIRSVIVCASISMCVCGGGGESDSKASFVL